MFIYYTTASAGDSNIIREGLKVSFVTGVNRTNQKIKERLKIIKETSDLLELLNGTHVQRKRN